jgi:hypothetical protein
MKIRCDLHVNGENRKLLLVPGPNELGERLALKLAGFLLFWTFDPKVDASIKTPALAQFEFLPDLVGLDDGGEIVLWVDCQTTTMNKLSKLTRRLPRARLVVLKEDERGAARLRADVEAGIDRPQRIEILSFPGTGFREWFGFLGEKAEVYGDSTERLINVVVNGHPVAADFKAF